MTIRIGAIGLGHRGFKLTQTVSTFDDVDVVALADIDSGRRKDAADKFGVTNTFEHLSQMLDSVELDAVLILTPDLGHKPQTIAALKSGCHVLVEKPPSYSLSDTKEMAQVSFDTGKQMMVAWNRTFGLLRLKEIFNNQPPDILIADYARPNPAYLSLIRTHIVNPFYYLCGNPEKILASGTMFDEIQEGNIAASIQFKNGAIGQLTASHGSGAHSERLTAFGSGYSVFIDRTGNGTGQVFSGGKLIETLQPVDTVKLQMRHFIDCVKNDKEPLNSARDAVAIMKMTHGIMESAGFTITEQPKDSRGWLLWCGCGGKVVANVKECPECGQQWAGWSIPPDKVMKV